MNLLPLWNNGALLVLVLTTAILGFACLAAVLLRRSAALRNSVLMPALIVTFVIPAVMLVARGSGWAIPLPVVTAESVTEDRSFVAIDPEAMARSMVAPRAPLETASEAPAAPSVPGTAEAASTDASAIPIASIVVIGLPVIWGAGTLVGLVRLARSYRSVQRLLAATEPGDDPRVAAAAAEARDSLGLPEYPSIAVTDRVSSPVAYGTPRRGWVICPPDSFDDMPHDRLVHVLMHEGAHIAHRDSSLRFVQAIGAALWWWHPLVHVLNRQLSRTREELCDNAVLSAADPVDYSQTLLEVRRRPVRHRPPALAAGLFPEHQRLERRIRSLLNPRRNTVNRSNPSVLLAVCLAGAAASALAGATRMTVVSNPPPALVYTGAEWVQDKNRVVAKEIILALEDESSPGHLDVDIKRGDILVTAYDGDEIRARISVPKSDAGAVVAWPLDFAVRQKGNFIELDGNSYTQITHVEVLVPRRIDLTLDTYRTGIIKVKGVSGHIRARSQNNDIVLTGVSGSADVYGYNGSFVADFLDVTGELEFETYNGDIDLTLPESLRATTEFRTERTAVRSDFAIAPRPVEPVIKEKADGTRSITFGDAAIGDINGGGRRLIVETTNGDVTLRKR